jgi:conjugal transfer pilus assembly protein TraV
MSANVEQARFARVPLRVAKAVAIVGCAVVFAGCTSLSGLDAESQFDCKAPKGLSCVSVSQTYAVSKAGNLPGQALGDRKDATDRRVHDAPPEVSPPGSGASESGAKRTAEAYSNRPAANVQFTTPAPVPTAVAAAPGSVQHLSPATFNAPSSGTPLRTPERVLRIWMAPFMDQEGDLHDQRYVYVTVTPGQWTLDAARAQIKQRYQPVRLVNKPDAASPAAAADASGNRPTPTAAAAFATGAIPGMANRTEEK